MLPGYEGREMIRGYGLWWVYLLVALGLSVLLERLGLSLGLITGISMGVLGAFMLWTHLIIKNRRKR